MIKIIRRWLRKRAAEKARIAACQEARKRSDDLVDMLMAGRVPIGEKVTFPEWCELTGTTTNEMAEAQEMADREGWEVNR